MNTISAAAPQKPLPVLTLLAHVDATPQDLEPFEVAEVDNFEKASRPDTQVRVELSRTSTSPWTKIAVGALELSAMPLAMAAAPALGPLGFVATVAGMMLAFNGTQKLADGIRTRLMTKEPVWNGTRVYDIGADQHSKTLDSKIVSETDVKRPGVKQLAQFVADGMKAYPAQVTAFMASGHGAAWQSCSGYTPGALKQALEMAATQSGRKLDVVILEACLMGNVEALQTLKDSARYAIVSEETMGAAGLPWQDILKSLPQGTMDAKTFSQRVVEGSVGARGIDTLAVIDLQKVDALSQSVEHLAKELRRVVAQGGKSEVRAALKDAAAFPRSFDPFTRLSFDVRDLGELSDSVTVHVHDKQAREAADDVRNALHAAVVASTTSPKYGNSSQISVQGPKPFFKSEKYVQDTGFSEWGGLLRDLRRFAS